MEFIRSYYPFIILGFNGLVVLIGWAISGKLVFKKECRECREGRDKKAEERANRQAKVAEDLADDLDDLERRITRNEERLKNQPTSEEVHDLTLAMTSLGGEVKGLASELGGQVAVLAERVEGVREAQKATKELANRLDSFLRNR